MRRVLVLLGLATVLALAAPPASAHPLGNFTVNRFARITLVPGEVRIDYVVDIAEIPTVQLTPRIEVDGDGSLDEQELDRWASEAAADVAANLALTIDDAHIDLAVTSSSATQRPGQGSLATLRVEVALVGPAPPEGTLTLEDRTQPDRLGWREIVAVGEDGIAIAGSSVPAESVTDGLLTYPEDLLSSPLDVRRASVSFAPGTSSVVPAPGPVANVSGRVEGGPFTSLVGRTGPFMLAALLLAFVFGAVHALGPGHGKTLMAAYVVGADTRVRHAVVVGGSVAVMHTASVLMLGVVALTATEAVPLERVYPWLGLGSGLVALGLGAVLLVWRLSAWGTDAAHHHDHGHPHPHPHGRAEPNGSASLLSRRGLVALAVAGGVLPSPTALVVLLGAIALGRVAYGVALIVAFSAGLAATLVVIGLGSMRARDAVVSRMSSSGARLMPVLSAGAITAFGLVLSARGLAQI